VDINRFTQKLQEALGAAQTKAVRYGHQQVDVEHLLSALLEQEGGLAVSILNKANVDVQAVLQRLDAELRKLPKVSSATGAAENVYITGRLNKLLAQAEDESKKLGDAFG
jgi:ATP-dependent Clp protease ATP-binding subunit ClpB